MTEATEAPVRLTSGPRRWWSWRGPAHDGRRRTRLALETVIEELVPDAFRNTDQYANNRIECDHGRLKARLRPMRGLKTDCTAGVVIAGHAFMQYLRRGFYELGVEAEPRLRIASAFDELTEAI